MNYETFTKSIAQIFVFFRYKDMPPTGAIDAWFEKVKYIPDHHLQRITGKITELENIPRNIPKAYMSAYGELKDSNSLIDYDPEEDMRFPVSKMWAAFNILSNEGQDSFERYCRSQKMPRMDRERVQLKHKCAFNVSEVKDFINSATKTENY